MIFIKSKKNAKGFSLLEVMVAIAVFTFVVTAAAGTFASIQRAWRRQKAAINIAQNARWTMELLANEIREGGNATSNPGGIAVGRGVRFRPYPGPPTGQVCYWRGNTASDATGRGNQTFLYRGVGNNVAQAYNVRQQVANLIVNNPDLVNNATGFPPADGLADPVFIYSGGVLTIELTFRPNPTLPAGTDNKDFTLRTRVITRN